MGGQEAAVAGSSAVIFTATDRKIIEERGGKVNDSRSFAEILKKRPLTPEVENEETSVKPQFNLKELEERRREHRHIIKHSTVYVPREHVEINNELPDKHEESKPIQLEAEAEKVESPPKAEMYDRLSEDQKSLNSVKIRIKDYHLKRLLTDDEKEFNRLSEKIKSESLAAIKPEARPWLAAQLNKITLGSARYKLSLLKSLEEMHLDERHKNTMKWLEKTIEQLLTSAQAS